MLQPSDKNEARKKALSLLEIRDRTEKELRDRLLRCGFDEETVLDAVEYVRSFHYIDDRRFAENYILNHKDSQSRQKILNSLFTKGVDPALSREVWEDSVGPEHSELSQVEKELRKKWPEGTVLPPDKLRNLYAALARKGYSYDDIRDAIHKRSDFFGDGE